MKTRGKPGLLLWLGLTVLLSACDYGEEPDAGAPEIPVSTTHAERRDVPLIEHAVGRIEQTGFATLAAEVAGRISELAVEAGDHVQQGQLLVRIDDGDYRAAVVQAESQCLGLKAQREAQKRLVERYQKLFPRHFVTRTQLDQVQAQLTHLDESVRAAVAALQQARHNLERTRILAPFDGRIQRRFVAAGDFITVGKPLLSISGKRGRHVRLPFPETLQGRIQSGQHVLLRLRGSDSRLEASISETTPRVNEYTGAFIARVDLPEEELGGAWRPGGSVEADVTVAIHRKALVLPEGAIVLRPAGYVVYIIRQGRVHARTVTPGVFLDGKVEILHGLQGDETIALDGAPYLSDGARVQETAGP